MIARDVNKCASHVVAFVAPRGHDELRKSLQTDWQVNEMNKKINCIDATSFVF